MKLDLTEDQEFFLATTRRFIESEAPVSAIRGRRDSGGGLDRAWWRRAADLGWTSMLVAEGLGGGSLSGRPLTDAVIVAEELGRVCGPGPLVPVNVVASMLSTHHGQSTDELLSDLVSGDATAAWAFGEPGNLWDPASMSCTAEAAGGDVVVTGVKSYVEAGDSADHFLVTARSGTGVSHVLVPAAWPGVTVMRSRSLDLSRGFATVRFDSASVPVSHVVGDLGDGAQDAERALQVALVMQAADTVGGLDRVFEFTRIYMDDRYAFGRPISSYQALKHRAADLLLVLETAKGCVDAATSHFDDASDESAIESRVAASYVGAHALHLVQECMQFHGGISMTWEHDIHVYLRRATVNRALYGTPEQLQDRICGLLGFGGEARL